MKKRLYLISALIAALFVVGGLAVWLSVTSIIATNEVRESKSMVRHKFDLALHSLQEAQKLLYRHQAGYDRDIDSLVDAVEDFDDQISDLRRYYISPSQTASCNRCHGNVQRVVSGAVIRLGQIIDLDQRFKEKVSIMLTTNDERQKPSLEKESAAIGAGIAELLGKMAVSMDAMVAGTTKFHAEATARSKKIVLFTVLLIVAGLVGILLYTLPRITRSVNDLIQGTEAIAAGDLTQRVNISAADEIGLLADRFNSMARSLEDREKQLRELNLNLERKVADRTRQIEESNQRLLETAQYLEHANRDLAELDRLKSDFITIASHELRTPLVTISGYLDLLREGLAGAMTATQQDMIEAAWKGSRRLNKIVKDILNVSWVESGRLVGRREPIDVSRALEEAVADQKDFADRRQQVIVVEDMSGLPSALGDRNMLIQVFINLVNNAIKYTPNGGRITIRAKTWKRAEIERWLAENHFFATQVGRLPGRDEDLLEIVVEDSGVGIPLSEQKRIFDMFYEVGDISTHSTGDYKFMGGGIGLGLSICKGFMEKQDGVIWAESAGRDEENFPGSRFHLLMSVSGAKATAIAEAEVTAPEAAPSRAADQPVHGDKPLILLVDDEPDILRFMEVLLRPKYELVGVASGHRGMDIARRLHPQLILLDLLIYDIDGYEITRILKGDPRTRDIPIVLFTAKSEKSVLEKGLAAGADDYLTKPFSNEELFAKIGKAIQRGRVREG